MLVVPKWTIDNWMKAFTSICSSLRVVKFLRDKKERKAIWDSPQAHDFDVCVTSYETTNIEKRKLKGIHCGYIIIDEAENLKNEHSDLSELMRTYKNLYVYVFRDLRYVVSNFGCPYKKSDSYSAFKDCLQHSGSDSDLESDTLDQQEVVVEVHKVVHRFLLRRLNSNEETSFPAKKETILKVGMSSKQTQLYCSGVFVNGNNMTMKMRKVSNHPNLSKDAKPVGPTYQTLEDLIENSGKMVLLDKLLHKLKERGSKVFIFSTMPTLLKILEEYLNYREYNYCKIYGGTRLEDRDEVIEAFNKEDKFVFLLSTGACGGGINLPIADVVIFYDSDWYALYYAKHDFVAHPRNRILILWYFCAFRNPHL
ncbi:probable chromatin-remodeling complex ATPase chain [Lolium rigidum]|uniref:probable chromatin-remodeling complex ATPase chain n=1 Tax=Lolium rigidum TaxID=89674 RepID=UPI001F5D7CD8|nr:probable chromatin-remodeling complex ATPase chain [Lolium rigidum]